MQDRAKNQIKNFSAQRCPIPTFPQFERGTKGVRKKPAPAPLDSCGRLRGGGFLSIYLFSERPNPVK
jgi:hypothetical protein